MSKEKYLVTGAAGFIGASVVKCLHDREKTVVAAVKKESDLWRLESINGLEIACLDVTDTDSVRELILKTRPSHIFHLATYGVYRDQTNEAIIFNTNITGTFNLLSACRDIEIDAFVNTGSVYEYADRSGIQKEEQTGIPRNIYDAAKLASTGLSQAFASEYKLPICTLRLFTTYGPQEDSRRLVTGTIRKLFSGERPVIASEAIRDFIYAEDVAEAYLKAAQLGTPGEVYNIASGKPVRVGELVNELCQIVNPKLTPIESNKFLPADDSRCWADITKAQEQLGWQPQTTLKQGLLKTVEWYKNKLM